MTPTPPPVPTATVTDVPPSVDLRLAGHVLWFCADRGFGYLASDTMAEPVFVRWSDIDAVGFRSVAEDERVTFLLDHDTAGPVARGVRREA